MDLERHGQPATVRRCIDAYTTQSSGARRAARTPRTKRRWHAHCPGSGGANLLTTTSLPWLGSTFRAAGTGLPTTCFVSQVHGFQPFARPLTAILPMAPPGGDLLVSPDFGGGA